MGVLTRYLQAQEHKFAVVDADPVGMLGQMLAAPAGTTIAELAERPPEDNPAAQTDWAAQQLTELLAPLPAGGQLVRMGHPVHNGCFCRVNALAQATINTLVARFPVVLVDNEAGVEHLTRGVGRYVTRLVLLSDTSRAGLQVAGDALRTVRALNTVYDNRLRGTAHLLVRLPATFKDAAREIIQQRVQAQNLPRPRFLPDDPRIAQAHFLGTPLPIYNGGEEWSPLYRAVDNWVQTEDLLTVQQ
jgi:CO dehydrogenase maturation factor